MSYRSNKTKKLFLLITFIFSSFFLLNNEKLAIGNTLNKYLWKNRIVLIFSKNHNDSLFLKQKRQFSNLKSEIAERDLIFIHVFGLIVSLIHYEMTLTYQNIYQSLPQVPLQQKDDTILSS